MSKLIALAYSDIHKHAFQDFAKTKYARLEVSLQAEAYIIRKAQQARVPILFAGDMFHDPASLTNKVIDESINGLTALDDTPLIAIAGNHDISEKNLADNISPSYIAALQKALNSVYDVSYHNMATHELFVCGVPYMHDPIAWKEKVKEKNKIVKGIKAFKILLIHRDLPGCQTPSGFECKDTADLPNDLDKLWSNFDLVLSGHIHKWHRVSKKCWMLGSPIHQDRGDEGCEMGYWEIYDKGKPKFKPLNKLFPCFVQLKEGEEPHNDKDYFIPYEAPIREEELKEGKFSTSLSSKKLVNRYFKVKGIKNKRRKRLLTELLNSAHNA